MIGHDHRHDDLYFPRTSSRYSPELERSPALSPAWKDWLAGGLIMLAIAIYFVVF